MRLFSILFHHQTTTKAVLARDGNGCLVSYFITKPQPWRISSMTPPVV